MHTLMAEEADVPAHTNWKMSLSVFFKDARYVLKRDELGMEILRIAFPAALALAADPIASLIDTAFIARLGSVQIAAVGVSITIFNQASKIAIFPLVNITTSFVAEEETLGRLNEYEAHQHNPTFEMINHSTAGDEDHQVEDDEEFKMSSCKSVDDLNKGKTTKNEERRQISSASTAMAFGGVLGLVQTILIFLAKPLLAIMGVKSGSAMLPAALKYLIIRSVGAPAVLLCLAMQGIFRGFKDTTTPLYAIVIGDVTNIILDPILIFVCGLGVSGATIAHVLSQYLISVVLLFKLMKQVNLLPPSIKDLQFSKFLKNGFWLLIKVIAATICVTLAASKAARLGPARMAAFQICLQLWLTLSLIGDALAVAAQAILACAFAEKDYKKAAAASARVLQMGFLLGLCLAFFIGIGLTFGSGIFTNDQSVMRVIAIAVPFVAGTQPINLIAFVFDGINSGSCDFAYSAYSMVVVSLVTIGSVFVLSKNYGFVGIWIALTIFMALRTFAGILRMATCSGPWRFLRVASLMPSNSNI